MNHPIRRQHRIQPSLRDDSLIKKNNLKHTKSILLTACLAVFLFLMLATPAFAADVSTYAELQTAAAAVTSDNVIRLAADISGDTQLTIGRSLKLDLNGYNLTIDLPDATGRTSNGIHLNSDVTLVIDDSVTGGGNALEVKNGATTRPQFACGAAIQTTNGTLVILSGAVNAYGGYCGAGIGGGFNDGVDSYDGSGGNIIILGGDVRAVGGNYSAGIGGGDGGVGGNIIINGGNVTAIGGGTGHETAGGGAGIGGGDGASSYTDGSGGNITINGGTVNATGGTGSAGIGGGFGGLRNAGGNITISGGNVSAQGGSGASGGGAGIGGGCYSTGASGNITITGDSDVIAIGGSGSPSGGAGIGSGGSTSTTFAPVNNIVIDESTAKVTSTGGTGTSGRHGANIGNGGRSSSEGTSVTPKTSVTLYTIKITAGAGGSIIPPNNIPIVANSNQVIIATADTGYVIDSITIDAVAQTITNKNQVFFVIPAVGADKAVIAAFAPKTVTVTNTQTGTLTYGTAGSATFPVTTTNIDDGIYTATLDGAPSSITADDVTIIGGTGTLTINTLATTGGGVHSMTITLDDATSGKFDLTVSPASQTPLVLVGLGTAYTYGDGPITLSITGGSGGGAVTYTSDNTAVATVSGTTVTINQSGTFNITATKAADSNYSLASVTPGIVTVSEAIPPATLSAAVTSGLDAVLTATVLPVGTGDVPSGTVTFLDGSATLATVPLDASGIAVYTDLSPARGSHSYTAEYNGQTNRYTTNSDTITVAVNPPSTGGSGFGTATIVSPTTPPSVFDNESNNERNNSVPDNGSSSNDFDNANDNSNNNENKNVDQNSGAVTYRLVFVLIVLFLYMLVVAALCFIPKK